MLTYFVTRALGLILVQTVASIVVALTMPTVPAIAMALVIFALVAWAEISLIHEVYAHPQEEEG